MKLPMDMAHVRGFVGKTEAINTFVTTIMTEDIAGFRSEGLRLAKSLQEKKKLEEFNESWNGMVAR